MLVSSTQISTSETCGKVSVPTAASTERTSGTQPGLSVGFINNSQLQRATRPRRRFDCTIKHCSCRCHYRVGISRRFWALDYNPWVALRGGCDRTECDATEYGVNLRVALSQLGVNWSLTIGVQVQLVANRVGLRPNLQVERIVPYTSLGFELIWRCKHGLITYEEAQTGLVKLHRSDPTFKNHVAPNGKSYIEVCLPSALEQLPSRG